MLVKFRRNPAARMGTRPKNLSNTTIGKTGEGLCCLKKTGTVSALLKAWSQCDTSSQVMIMTDGFADKVSSRIGRSDTQWIGGTFRGDEAKDCLNISGFGIFSSYSQVRAKSCEAPLRALKLYQDEVMIYNNLRRELRSTPHVAQPRRCCPVCQ